MTIGQNLIADDGGSLDVGRNVSGININGNLDTSGVGQINIGGNLETITVQGEVIGNGVNDINVGLSVNGFNVSGGQANNGGVQNLNMAVGKNIINLNVSHGIFHSFITAGVLISNVNIGPDGVIALFDSTLMAGAEITNITLDGDVKSDQPTNPAGQPTRMIAGEDRQGDLEDGGQIDHLQITGSLIDSVIAASVKPKFGTAYSTPPTGSIVTGYVNGPSSVRKNYTTTLADLKAGYDFLTGYINASLAPTPLPPATIANTLPGTLPIPLPSQPTVNVGVIQTSPHVPGTDYAGLYATNVAGVIVGPLPKL